MGQIVGGAAKPKRCNINKLSQLGTPAAGEYILVSSDNSMNAAGQGNFDCYIVGDGKTAATALELKSLADDVPTSGSKNAVSSGGVYDSIEGKEETNLMLTAGQGLNPNGTTYANTTASITDYISVNEGEKINFYGIGANTYGAIAGYNASKTFVTNLLTHTGQILNTSVVIPSGIAYIRCAARNHTYSATTPDPSASLSTFDPVLRASGKYISCNAQSFNDNDKAQARNNISAAPNEITTSGSIYSENNGYYRENSQGTGYYFASSSGFKVSNLIPLVVGQTIKVGTSFVPPYSTVLNVFFDGTAQSPVSNPVAVAELDSNGSITITQNMLDNGYRYIGFSFRDSDSKTIQISTPILQEISNIREMTEEATEELPTIRIYKYSEAIFKLYIQSGKSSPICYIFEKLYKKWDSLEYEDGNGNTSTLQNVVSSDYWNNSYVCIGDGYNNTSPNYIIQGNTNFIYKISGAANHVGNGHGCEASIFRKFLADGVEIDIEAMSIGDEIKCSTFRYIQKSNCYATNGTGNEYRTTYPQINTDGTLKVDCRHYMDCLFEPDNRITIDNRLEILRDNIIFIQCHAAMLECNYGKFSIVTVNDTENTINNISDNGDFSLDGGSAVHLDTVGNVVANKAEMFGKNFFVSQEIVPTNPSRFTKCNILPFKYSDRLKLYFMPVGTSTSGSQVETETFNAGDVITVKATRKIEAVID